MDRENQQNSNAYFNNKRIRRHLIKAGLINRQGEILPPPLHEGTFTRRTKRRQTITNYVIEDERKRQLFLRNQFDLAIKRSRVQKIRESTDQKQRSMSYSFIHLSKHRNTRAPSPASQKQRSPVRAKSARHSPVNIKNQIRRRPLPAKQSSSNDYCQVTMIYYGPPTNLEYKKTWYQPNGDEIIVMQQHCGGENLPVFKGFVRPNETFTFDSHRHLDYPFALALYINGLIDSRISVCCEYKHKHNVRLGSKYGLFGIYDVQKSQPCRMCRFEQRKKKILSTERLNLSMDVRPGALLRTPMTSPRREKTSTRDETNRISTVVQASVSPRISISTSSENKDETNKDDSRKSSRVSSSTSTKSGPSSSTILLQNEIPHHSSEPILSKRNDDSLNSSIKSDHSPSPLSEHDRQSLPENKNKNSSTRSSSKISSSTASIKNNEHPTRRSSSSSSMTLKRLSASPSSSSIFSEKEDEHPTMKLLSDQVDIEKQSLTNSVLSTTEESDSSVLSETNRPSIKNVHESPRSSSFSTDSQAVNEIIIQKPVTSDTESSDDTQSDVQERRNEVTEPSSPKPQKLPERQYRAVENIILVWLDSHIDQPDPDTLHSKTQLRQIARTVRTFTDPTKCLQLFQEMKNERIFLIVSGSLSETILPQIDHYPQLVVVYIFCQQKYQYEQFLDQYPKLKGVDTDIANICQQLKMDFKQWDNDLSTFQISSGLDSELPFNSEQLLFIQNQLFKEYLLQIHYEEHAIHDLSDYCRKLYTENDEELEIIQEFEENYTADKAIDWYTKDCFVYHMLNRAIRMKDMKILFQMGFLLRDLHQQLEEGYSAADLIVFRGQGMKIEYFEDLKASQGGLLSFNGFVSTSKKQNIAYEFAQRSLSNGFPIAVLFRIKINRKTTSSPSISLENRGTHPSEYEVLLSFKSIFHIDTLEQIESNLWQIDLILTDQLSSSIQTENSKYHHLNADDKLGELLIEMNEFTKAKDLYEINIPNQSSPKYAYVYNQLARISMKLEAYNQALLYYNLALRTKFQDYVVISNIHKEIGKIFYQQMKFREALEKFQCALNIQLEHLPDNDVSLINTYDLLAMFYEEQEDYQTALEYYQKQLDIQEEWELTKPEDLAETYFKIGICLENLNRFNEALDYVQKSIDIATSDDRQEVLERLRERIE